MPASPRSGASSDRKRHASSGDRVTPVGCRSSRLRATGRESAAAVPSRARSVSCGFVNRRPRRRIDASRRGPDLLGRERDLRAFSGLEDVRERERAAGLGRRHDADSEAQQALGQGIQKREAPLGQARQDAGLERAGRRSGERGDDLGLGSVARAAPLGRKDVPEDVARRRVHGLVEKREEQPARGRERAVGSQAHARRQDRARHRRHRFGETPETLPLVGIVEDGPPAGMRAVGSRRDAAPEQEVEHPARHLGPVVEIVARRHGQRARAKGRREREQRLESGRHGQHESGDFVGPERGGEGRRVVGGLPERRRGRNGTPVNGGDDERERGRLRALGDRRREPLGAQRLQELARLERRAGAGPARRVARRAPPPTGRIRTGAEHRGGRSSRPLSAILGLG